MTFVSINSKLFTSILQSSRRRVIWCKSSRDFARLRPFVVIHRLLVTASRRFATKKFARLRASSPEFDSLHPSFCSKSSLFRAFELSCFRDWFTSSIRGKRKYENKQPLMAAKQRTPTDRPATQVDAGMIRISFFPRCQRSIVLVRFEQNRDWLRTSRCLPRYCSSQHRSNVDCARHVANAFASTQDSAT